MAFIEHADAQEPTGRVAELYEESLEDRGYVPNYLSALAHRPDVYAAWRGLAGTVSSHLDSRLYELVTLAAARARRSSYCSLAHGSALLWHHLDAAQLMDVLRGGTADLTELETAAMRFADKAARDAAAVTQQDVDELRAAGLTDQQVVDIASTVAARCFFTTLLDALGVDPDAVYRATLEPELLAELAVGRPVPEEPGQ
jgi:uncharacterized peroxidase-related enzyme